MRFSLVLWLLGFLTSCTTVKSQTDAYVEIIVDELPQVCTTTSLSMFITCKEIQLTPCGANLFDCEGGASYYCMQNLICQPTELDTVFGSEDS